MARYIAASALVSAIGILLFSLNVDIKTGVDASYEKSDSGETKYVTCQSAIKLSHVESGGSYYLNSGNQNYGSGSGQQVVSVTPEQGDHSSLWVIREAHDTPQCPAGTPVKCNRTIRLTHNNSGRNLHSHSMRAALTGQQEVSGFGENGEGDSGDDWRVICADGGEDGKWVRGKPIRLQHIHTGAYLGATKGAKFDERNCGNCPILHHLEAFARERADTYTTFRVEKGIHLSI